MFSMKSVFIFILRCYQATISPFFGHCCRFSPTCSEYSIQSIKKYGILKASWLILKRISKCHPFHKGGIDLPKE
ncbi:MAG TPA: membrane protein insertion efficiency factor YidD [Chlamydiales bacterium]|nr:membrane protein insertion efficiency factor YidD [Chlamydiales bacterium]